MQGKPIAPVDTRVLNFRLCLCNQIQSLNLHQFYFASW